MLRWMVSTHMPISWRHIKDCCDNVRGVGSFHKRLELAGESERVLVMTFSEFGRRLKENASEEPITVQRLRCFCLAQAAAIAGWFNTVVGGPGRWGFEASHTIFAPSMLR